ncbi:MAG: GerMN domain-containing protein [Desulfuromonadales bacterium]
MKSPFKDRLLILSFVLALLVLAVIVVSMYVMSRPATPPTPAAEIAEETRQVREITLYFGSAEATHLVPEAREIEECPEEQECVRATVQALIGGPVGDLVPILPNSAIIREITLQDSTAVLSFSRDLVSAHPGGSISELLTVYGLADTLAVNFPHIRQVRILVEGQPVETLKGHLGLLGPIKADFTYSRPPEGSALAADPANAKTAGGH